MRINSKKRLNLTLDVALVRELRKKRLNISRHVEKLLLRDLAIKENHSVLDGKNRWDTLYGTKLWACYRLSFEDITGFYEFVVTLISTLLITSFI